MSETRKRQILALTRTLESLMGYTLSHRTKARKHIKTLLNPADPYLIIYGRHIPGVDSKGLFIDPQKRSIWEVRDKADLTKVNLSLKGAERLLDRWGLELDEQGWGTITYSSNNYPGTVLDMSTLLSNGLDNLNERLRKVNG